MNMIRNIRGSPEQYILVNIEIRMERTGRYYLQKYGCGLSRAGICLEDLVQIGLMAALEEIRSSCTDWVSATSETYDALERSASARGARRIHARIVDFFRANDHASRAAERMALIMPSSDEGPSRQLEARSQLEALQADARLRRLVVAAQESDSPTKASLGRVLGVDAKTISRMQCEARKKFD